MAGRSSRELIQYRFDKMVDSCHNIVSKGDEIMELSQGRAKSVVHNIPVIQGAVVELAGAIKTAKEDFESE
jgi:hypothetical protein